MTRKFLLLSGIILLFYQAVGQKNNLLLQSTQHKKKDTSINMKISNYGDTIINNGFVIANAVEISGDTLFLLPHPSGTGSVSWFFEIFDNRLVVVDFRWHVRPHTIVGLNSKYIRSLKKTETMAKADLKYEFHYDDAYNINYAANWVRLVGNIEGDIKVDIKINYPYWTDIEDVEYKQLLSKYGLTKKYQTSKYQNY